MDGHIVKKKICTFDLLVCIVFLYDILSIKDIYARIKTYLCENNNKNKKRRTSDHYLKSIN